MRHFLIAAFLLACAQAAASSHPVEPRELVHPYPPTGPVDIAGTAAAGKVLRTVQRYAAPAFTDVLAMHVAQTLQGASDQPVVVTRRSRQGGHDAIVTVSSAAADGRTLLLASAIPAAKASAHLNSGADSGLRPVALVASMPFVLIASSDSKHASLHDLIGEARLARDRVLIGSTGEHSAAHAAIELLRLRRGLPLEPIAYNGGNAALQALATKQVSIALVPLPAALPYLVGGRVRALAIAQSRRHPRIPKVQTSAEAGVADLEAAAWFGVFAPAGTPQSVIHELSERLARSPQSEQTQQVFSDAGLRLEHRGADVFAELLARAHQARRGITGITSREGVRPPS